MELKKRLNRKGYKGRNRTNHEISELLGIALEKIKKEQKNHPNLIFSAWPGIVGPAIASMSYVSSLHEGALTVVVKQSTLYSVLVQYEGKRILSTIKQQFPNQGVEKIIFKMGQ